MMFMCIMNYSYSSLIYLFFQPTFVILLLVFLLLHAYKIHKNYQTFRKLGLPGPKPRFFFGNLIELFTHHRHSSACLAGWTKTYGKIYGYFIGHTPIICISDPDLLQEIFITKFSSFHSRRPLPLQQLDLRHLLASTGKLTFLFTCPWVMVRKKFVVSHE